MIGERHYFEPVTPYPCMTTEELNKESDRMLEETELQMSLDDAREQGIEEGREEAYSNRFDDGIIAGRKEGREAGRQEMIEHLSRFIDQYK